MPVLDPGEQARAIAILRDPATIRARSHALLALGVQGRLAHFSVDLSRLDDAAEYVAAVIRQAYPSLEIPYHARWRHFAAGGRDRWGALVATLGGTDAAEIARVRFDLCVVSVLLDAGAGAAWRFIEPGTGEAIARSEGLAVASLHAFRAGLFSGDPDRKLRADAAGLSALTAASLADAFQASPDNPLEGLEGRAALLRALGKVLAERPGLFGEDPRVGGLYDALLAQATDGALPATAILAAILDGLGPIWPDRLQLGGQSLGDVWQHPAVEAPDATAGLIPFHKLSQWLSYSLVEVLEESGLRVTGLDALTGLPEYRNGGLFLDLGVIALRDPSLASRPLAVSDPAIVEWRALTVALLDRIADPIRTRLGRTAADLPLARILEGGTWAAGRRIAGERRPGGGPPLTVLSDGTVF
ncbi:MAG: URC4/urg3 family protein [Acetobacteraceae bacterium]|nr:URC4/urg3 family protein [Acetobacteraceae bacterium]